MAEYISREELIKALETDYNRSWCSKPQGVEEYVEGARDEYDDVLRIVCGMKEADVQQVKRAKWEDEYLEDDVWCAECTNCKNETHSRYGRVSSYIYCPNCGADMRKENTND